MRVLMALMTKGATQPSKSGSYSASFTFGCRAVKPWPVGQSEYGFASCLRVFGSAAASLNAFIALATVPPENPPLMALTRNLTRVQGFPKRRTDSRWRKCTPRSDGIESKPQLWTMRAPDLRAAASYFAIIRWIHWGSPVRSQ